LDNKEYIQQFEINNPWTIRKIFVYIFYAPIYNLLIFLINLFWWYLGWAIIAITVFIRLLLLYPQHKMMLSQKKLQAIQPKIKEIQKQYKWQQQVLWIKLMELYKKEKVNPMWSCWFLFIQMPILLVVYRVILSIKDLSNYYYLYPSLSSFDLQSVIYEFIWIDLLNKWWIAWIILALSVWSIQFIQIKLSLANKDSQNKKWVILEKKKWKDDYSQFMPEPEMMNKFMLYWMPAMVTVFTYNLFAGVWLYWWISTLFMVFQQLFVNKVLNKSSNNS
jgi:YidC/Oxa1 family membrane protein insertase